MGASLADEIEAATGVRPNNPQRPFSGVRSEMMREFLGIGSKLHPNTADFACACKVTPEAVQKWAREPWRINEERAHQLLSVSLAATRGAGGRAAALQGLFGSSEEGERRERAVGGWPWLDEEFEIVAKLSDYDLAVLMRASAALLEADARRRGPDGRRAALNVAEQAAAIAGIRPGRFGCRPALRLILSAVSEITANRIAELARALADSRKGIVVRAER